MRRVTYVSRFNSSLDCVAVEEIGRQAAARNLELGVTGFLLYTDGVFFQVIEGEDEVIGDLFDRIRGDTRHHDVLCIENKVGEFQREFADWSMETIDLTVDTDLLMKPIRVLMNALGGTLGVLERYAQPSVLEFLEQGIDPSTVRPERTRRLVVFADIMGFSGLASVLSPEDTLALANSFVEDCAGALQQRGGLLLKLVGDSVMASFGVDAADDALDFALDLFRRLELRRSAAVAGSPDGVLYAGVGIAAGRVVVGNVGTSSKLDYTLFGDTVNRASHLESLTRTLGRRLVLSEAVRSLTTRPWRFTPLGEFELKAAAGLTRAYSVDDPATLRDASGLDDMAHILRFVEARAGTARPA